MKKNNIIEKLFLNFYDSKKVLYIVKQDMSNKKRYVTYMGEVRGVREQNIKMINRDSLKDKIKFFSSNQLKLLRNYLNNV